MLAVCPTGMVPVAAGYKPRGAYRLQAYVPKRTRAHDLFALLDINYP